MSNLPLSGLRVVEYGRHISGPYCAKLLADLGADVVKIEDHESDDSRKTGPFPNDIKNLEKSGLFLFLNTNKKGIVLDMADSADGKTFQTLIRYCDIFIENNSSEVLKKFEIDYDRLKEINPKLIMASLSPFGRSGPYRHYQANEFILYHMSGMGYGTPGTVKNREKEYPLWAQASIVQFRSGLAGAVAVMHAVLNRQQAKGGQHIDVSAMEASVSVSLVDLARYFYSNQKTSRQEGTVIPAPAHILPCRDGYVHLQCIEADQWKRFLRTMGDPQWGNDKRFEDGESRYRHWSVLEPLLIERLSEYSKKELTALLQNIKVPCTPLNTAEDLVKSNHLQERGFFREVDHPVAGKLIYPTAMARFSETPFSLRKAAPLLGENRGEDVVENWQDRSRENTPDQSAPFSFNRIRILDLSSVLAGPAAAGYLSVMGAEVIKCESRNKVDLIRRISDGVAFDACNSGKKSFTLNLSHPKGPELVKELVCLSDVVIDNFPSNVTEKFGLGYHHLKRLKPDIIVASCTGFGKTGPEKNYLAYGRNLHAASGLSGLIGYADGKPLGLSGQWSDTLAPLSLLYAILVALFYKAATGKGQFIDVAMVEATASLLGEPMMDYLINRRIRPCRGNRTPEQAPQGCYPCKGEDKWAALSVTTDRQWRDLLTVMERNDLAEKNDFADLSGRYKNHDELDRIISKWTSAYTVEEVTGKLQEKNIPAGPVIDTSEGLAEDPHLNGRSFFADIDRFGEKRKIFKLPWFNDQGSFHYRRGPEIGEHNAYVFQEILGLSDERYKSLIEEKVID